jgi:predicted amidohydrolase YtcJ
LAAACDNPIKPEESLDRSTALAMYGARQLQVGATADLMAVDRNPLTTDDLGATRVSVTFIEGTAIHARTLPWPG